MFLDAYNFITMEQTGSPGNIGDSLSETSRYLTLLGVIGDKTVINLSPFITDKGILRHPLSPWRESDTSSDQVSPLIAAASVSSQFLIEDKVLGFTKYKTGNGDFITLGLLANKRRAQNKHFLWISDLAILAQALIFKLPYNIVNYKLVKNNGTSDYLNFVNNLAFAKFKKNETWPLKLAKWLTPKNKILQKIRLYYRPEPNSQWLIDIYEKALGEIYGRV